MKHDKEYLREWMEFAEQIRQDSSKTADDSDNHGESSQPFKEQHANISTLEQSGFTSFGNADAVPVEATHSFGLQKLINIAIYPVNARALSGAIPAREQKQI